MMAAKRPERRALLGEGASRVNAQAAAAPDRPAAPGLPFPEGRRKTDRRTGPPDMKRPSPEPLAGWRSGLRRASERPSALGGIDYAFRNFIFSSLTA